MVTFSDADASTSKLLQQVRAKNHQALDAAKVTIDIQFCIGEEGAPAVKVNGYETFGRITLFQADKRAKGSPDARIQLDHFQWDQSEIDEREAMLDHLLQRIEIRTKADDSAEIIRDAAGRPKLKFRKYDLRLAGFSIISERHGRNSPEFRAVDSMRKQFGQLMLFALAPSKLVDSDSDAQAEGKASDKTSGRGRKGKGGDIPAVAGQIGMGQVHA